MNLHRSTVARCALARAATIEVCEPRQLLTTIASGQRVDSSISDAGERDSYTIDVTNGVLIVDLAKRSGGTGFDAAVDILNPDGDDASLITKADNVYFVDAKGASGTYTVRVHDGVGGQTEDATGGYRLSVFTPGTQADADGDDPSDTPDNTDVNSGRRFAEQISPGDLDVFRIQAKKHQSLSVTLGRNDEGVDIDPVATIIAPDGTIVAREVARYDWRAGQTGTYFAVITESGNDETGYYGAAFTRVPGEQYAGDTDTVNLKQGVARDGDLPSGDVDVYTLQVLPNTTINATLGVRDVTTDGFVPQLTLYGPDGRMITVASGNQDDGVTLGKQTATVGGTYYIRVRDNDYSGGGAVTFEYTLSHGDGLSNGLSNGTLSVDGSDNADTIRLAANTVQDYDVVTISGASVDGSYYAGNVSRVEVNANGGNDSVDTTNESINTYVSGGDGDDTIKTGDGSDTLTGGAGKNRLYAGSGNDRLNGSGGRDFLFGEGGDDRLYGNGGNDYLDGGGNVDRIWGGDGDDSLIGGSSNDRLWGEAGNDTLNGGNGSNYLNGGDGDDRVVSRRDGDELISIEST